MTIVFLFEIMLEFAASNHEVGELLATEIFCNNGHIAIINMHDHSENNGLHFIAQTSDEECLQELSA